MRIIAGEFRGRRLFSPDGLTVRPTADRVRESLFNILGRRVVGAAVLDLFAGTGAMGLEALSRGAASAVFVDHHPRALDVIRKNIAHLGVAKRCRVLRADVARPTGGLRSAGVFDLVFLDPPYEKGLVATALEFLTAAALLTPDALIVAEHGGGESWSPASFSLELSDQRRYGGTFVSFMNHIPSSSDGTPGERD